MFKIALINTAWAPFYVLVIGIVLVLLADLILRENAREAVVVITTLTLGAAVALVFYAEGKDSGTSLFQFQEFFLAFSIIALLSSIIVVFSAWKDFSLELDLGVFFSLLLLANLGGLAIASAQNFIPLYVGYELVSIPTYAMVAFRKKNRDAAEAGLKIFLLGALSSAFIIYGLAMYYGATGTLAFAATAHEGSETLKLAAVALIASGCGFKIGLVPFHFWIPDVYAGAPISVVNFLAASSKKMAFAFVFQLFFVGMGAWYETWGILFAALATLSMLLGNIAAIIQDKLMRILAYSTIAQAGYITIGIAAFAAAGTVDNTQLVKYAAMRGIIFHIMAHVLMKGAAIVAVLLVVSTYGSDDINNFKGLFHKSPLVASALAIALFSLMGIPPTAGFFGKFFLFFAAVDAGLMWLAFVGVVGSAISIFYYARVLRIMVDKPDDNTTVVPHLPLRVLLVVLTILTLTLGIFGENILTLSENIVDNIP